MLYLGNEKLKSYLSSQRIWLGVGEKSESKWKGLRFVAEESGSSVGWTKVGDAPDISLQYSMDDGNTWNDYPSDVNVDIPKGKWMCVKATSKNTVMSSSLLNYNGFQMQGKIGAYGNIMSLLDGTNYETMTDLTGKNYCFCRLFYNCASLTKASDLPATKLANHCYFYMFYKCNSLTEAPNLPAMNLNEHCYSSMFSGCTSLTQAPELPSTTMVSYCYSSMFNGCTSLTKAPKLHTTTLANYCYSRMFYNCKNLESIPPIECGTYSRLCFSAMFYNCSKLQEVQFLNGYISSTTNYADAFTETFYGCTNLKRVKVTGNWLNTISSDTFTGCSNLELVYMADANYTASPYQLRSITSSKDWKVVLKDSFYEQAIVEYFWQSLLRNHGVKASEYPDPFITT